MDTSEIKFLYDGRYILTLIHILLIFLTVTPQNQLSHILK